MFLKYKKAPLVPATSSVTVVRAPSLPASVNKATTLVFENDKASDLTPTIVRSLVIDKSKLKLKGPLSATTL